MKSSEGFIDVPGGKVWFVRMGESVETPLLVMHGGPGNTHDPLKAALEPLAEDRTVIFYDQLGSGHSDRPTNPSLWTVQRFVEELAQVRQALELDHVHLLGHSWGTMLAASYLLDRKDTGVKSVIFSSPCLSAERWKQDADVLIARLPKDVQTVIARHEELGSTDSPAYQEAMNVYYDRYVCRLVPRPSILTESRAKANKDVYMTMWGPSEFSPTGNLKTYNVTSRLHEISIPSLFVCGRYDEATPESTQYYQSLVPDSQFHILENSSHLGYLEETDAYLAIVRDFLSKVE